MAWIFNYISLREFTNLVICLSLDITEYFLPFLLAPLVGDIFDFIGIITSVYLFKWVGLFATLELIPGADVLPINTITWAIWFILKRQREEMERQTKG